MSETRTALFQAGDRFIFERYADPNMPETAYIFRLGDFGVVAKINDDGGLQCFLTDADGDITSLDGDTLFPEEIQRLGYAPRLDVAAVAR